MRPAAAQGGCDPTATPTAVPAAQIHHYHLDHLGSPQTVTDGAGVIVHQVRYDPYGKVRGRWRPTARRREYSMTSMLLTVPLLMLLQLAASPQEPEHDSSVGGATTQSAISKAMVEALKRQDAEMERLYVKYVATLSPDDRRRLMAAQESWVLYRDAQCTAVYELYAGGTMAATQLEACRRRLAADRVRELRSTYEQD